MSDMITIRAIKTESPSTRLNTARDARHALDSLEAIINGLAGAEVQARASAALETVRAVLAR